MTLFKFGACGAYILSVYINYCYLQRKRRREYFENLLQDDNNKESQWEAFHMLTTNDLQFEFQTSLETRGLVSTYGIPTISSLLKSTGGFERDAQRRYADMSLLISEFLENNSNGSSNPSIGQPERAKLAVQRLNAIHDKYGDKILHRDMLYVLSVFLVTPCELCNTRWSVRPLTAKEKHCRYLYYMELGRQMNIEVDKAWKCYEDSRLFKISYEKKYMTYKDENRDVVFATVDYFIQTYPRLFRPIIRYLALQILSTMQESSLHRVSLGLPSLNPLISIPVDFILTCRATFLRYFSFPKPNWSHRLSGFRPITDSNSQNTAGAGQGVDGITCPYRQYFTARPLDFGNSTYTIEKPNGKTYSIETLGPRGIKQGILCEKPRYSFKDE